MTTSPKILIVGNICKDIIYYCDSYPREDTKVKATDRAIRLGGNAGNILQVLPQFRNNDGSVRAFVKLGSCSYSGEVLEFLKSKLGAGNVFSSVYQGTSLPESVLIASTATGSRTCLHYRGDCPDLTLTDLRQEVSDLVPYAWVHFEFRRNSGEVVRMIRHVREMGLHVKISLEVEKVREQMDEALGLVDYAIVSKEVCRDLGYRSLEEALGFLGPKVRRTLIVTWGEKGAGWVEDGVSGVWMAVKLKKGEIVDSIGAGDTFTAAFIHWSSTGMWVGGAVEKACWAAAQKLKQHGFENLAL